MKFQQSFVHHSHLVHDTENCFITINGIKFKVSGVKFSILWSKWEKSADNKKITKK